MRVKKRELEFNLTGDYKYDALTEASVDEFNSNTNWIYIAFNGDDTSSAKIGMTTGNLASRSYSSGNPDYWIFCAFKCLHTLSASQVTDIESSVLEKISQIYTRKKHRSSGRNSEWFNGDRLEIFREVHYILYSSHRNSVSISGYGDDDYDDGEFVFCEFNSNINRYEINRYIESILM